MQQAEMTEQRSEQRNHVFRAWCGPHVQAGLGKEEVAAVCTSTSEKVRRHGMCDPA
jgi:hypothetical protein